MQDRVSLYPGRVKLTPVSGQENTYDMVRADEPTQEGTPLNKATLLKDATAALFGLGADAVPDDALAVLKTITDNHGDAIANGVKIATGSYVGTGTSGSSNPCSLTFDFEPQVVFIGPFRCAAQKSAVNTLLRNCGEATLYSDEYADANISVSWNGNTVSWWNSNFSVGPLYQANQYGWTYYYMAIGVGLIQ